MGKTICSFVPRVFPRPEVFRGPSASAPLLRPLCFGGSVRRLLPPAMAAVPLRGDAGAGATLPEGPSRTHAQADGYPFANPPAGEPRTAARFLVTKCSWRGKYRRVLCISDAAVTTLDPASLEVTNHYAFAGQDGDFEACRIEGAMETAAGRGANAEGEFVLVVRQNRTAKFKPMRFISAHRAALLTTLPTRNR